MCDCCWYAELINCLFGCQHKLGHFWKDAVLKTVDPRLKTELLMLCRHYMYFDDFISFVSSGIVPTLSSVIKVIA